MSKRSEIKIGDLVKLLTTGHLGIVARISRYSHGDSPTYLIELLNSGKYCSWSNAKNLIVISEVLSNEKR